MPNAQIFFEIFMILDSTNTPANLIHCPIAFTVRSPFSISNLNHFSCKPFLNSDASSLIYNIVQTLKQKLICMLCILKTDFFGKKCTMFWTFKI